MSKQGQLLGHSLATESLTFCSFPAPRLLVIRGSLVIASRLGLCAPSRYGLGNPGNTRRAYRKMAFLRSLARQRSWWSGESRGSFSADGAEQDVNGENNPQPGGPLAGHWPEDGKVWTYSNG